MIMSEAAQKLEATARICTGATQFVGGAKDARLSARAAQIRLAASQGKPNNGGRLQQPVTSTEGEAEDVMNMVMEGAKGVGNAELVVLEGSPLKLPKLMMRVDEDGRDEKDGASAADGGSPKLKRVESEEGVGLRV